MNIRSNHFIPAARIAVHNPNLQAAVAQATGSAYHKRQTAMFAFGRPHGEALRQQAAAARRRALSHLPELLEQAEARMTANGITVLWALDADQANCLVLDIARQHNVRLVAKSKSMISEEIGLNHRLEAEGIRVVETDLGEFIVQLARETPSHIVTPVIHKSKDSIRDLFVRQLGMPSTNDAADMTRFARRYLREIFLQANMGISGGNFIIAETGTLCLVTNEGNGRMVTSLPPVHVALVGIEKIVATLEDYATLTQVLTRSATGQSMSVYTHLINGPRRPDETDGPEHLYVILVDNGRSAIYASGYCEALACIRCGACLNACPVYQATGGHAYGWVYPGPIGAVITPLLAGLQNATPLPYASSLCGLCKEVCPVIIDLPRMLLDLRRDLVQHRHTGLFWALGMTAWAFVFRSPLLFDLALRLAALLPTSFLNRPLPGPLGAWTASRDLPTFARRPFRRLWQQRQQM